nr:immunoglobulin light chain junction region [Macaca mulatta]MOX69088.1 immunoglobulin light chain junction region [Macaca mulatta]MOX69184.1 immunoglobulin light chain junction region [Macaca mulatta]MOX69351.1 immunoglobulin light chain junction region [Macaca mulatta]MOX69446.1 immunoglobulin light chain junction region [Macaca mulatta]
DYYCAVWHGSASYIF